VINPSQRPLPAQDNTTQKDGTNIRALRGISTYDLSVHTIKLFASDRAAIRTSFIVNSILLKIGLNLGLGTAIIAQT